MWHHATRRNSKNRSTLLIYLPLARLNKEEEKKFASKTAKRSPFFVLIYIVIFQEVGGKSKASGVIALASSAVSAVR
jgi:hypothetical protein